MTTSARQSGSWVGVERLYGREGGAWEDSAVDHAYVMQSGSWVQFDKPTRLAVSDGSFCDTSGQFEQPVYRQTWSWDNFHYANITHVELWVDDGGGWVEHNTVAVGTSGQRQSETFGSDLSGGHLLPGTYDCKVRYEYSGGSHSPYSNVETISVSNPCL